MCTTRNWLMPIAVALALGGASTASAAGAEPQALALVATGGEVELKCEGGECGAEFTTFCLQSDRFSPVRGTAYRLAGAGDLALRGTARDGREVSLDPRAFLAIESLRAHLAVRVSISRERLELLGLEKVAVRVGEGVLMVPQSEADDAGALAVLSRSLRGLGSRIVDRNERRMVAARITNRMINDLPERGGAGAAGGDAAWRRAVGGEDRSALAPGAVDLARSAYELCYYAVTSDSLGSLRKCLQTHHDGFVGFLNSRNWTAVKTGS